MKKVVLRCVRLNALFGVAKKIVQIQLPRPVYQVRQS